MRDEEVSRLRDMMQRRGPDGAGLWRRGNIVLAHRRLAVIDPGPGGGGAQPMVTPDGRCAITYNGMLYNDAELRRELTACGVRFRTVCDTETVLQALAQWGVAALGRLRGMYALGFYDVRSHMLVLARDPLGIKPLYFWVTDGEDAQIVFASEPGPIVSHPSVGARPDLAVVSAYLTTIRTTLGNRTMFDGVRTLRPGQALVLDLSGDAGGGGRIGMEIHEHWAGPPVGRSAPDAARRVRACVRESVRLHLRSDVPACSLLSGGLDSSILASEMCEAVRDGSAGPWLSEVRTYCSGSDPEAMDGDFAFARQVAGTLSTTHSEAPVTREMFRQRWPAMVSALGMPLSTPNEVAINEVARRLRADGQVVALSGEGADELFAGYDVAMAEALAFEESRKTGKQESRKSGVRGGLHQLHGNAWAPLQVKGVLLNQDVWRGLESDAALTAFYEEEFAATAAECGDEADPLDAHQRFHRRINLAGLLQRLDTATMLESVEGRTPLADRAVAELAESLPMSVKFGPEAGAAGERGWYTKRVLREAYADRLPREVVMRPKASFPLPFQEWVADQADVLSRSAFARELFSEAALAMVAAAPSKNWRLAWPMMNLAMWGEKWWG